MIAKRRLLQIHKWCGLAVFAFVMVQAVTGTMLVFRAELAQLIDPAGMVRHTVAGEAPLGRVVASARAVYPGYELQRIVFPQLPRATYFAHLVDARGVVRYASVDPGDGAVLRSGSIWRFPVEAALLIHYQLMSGRLGLTVVLTLGLVLLVMAASGVAYWWPRPGRWRAGLSINWRMPGRVVLRQVHRVLGPVACLLVGLSAATGVVLAFALIVGPGSTRSTAPSGLPPVSDANIDRAFALARDAFPGRAIRDIRMPAPGRFNVFFWAPERQPEAVHGVKIDLLAARITAIVPAAADRSLSTAVLPIHMGETAGLPGRLLILIEGLALAVLGVTGPLTWLLTARGARKARATS
ncbi:MAG TPA: PepSY-associated TM helix domain-containing protein [Phenylobacterium sp.]|nr:PepSY-associated TM helix domain-containing protein [Phenylobacterium sp.]